jgi:predicted metal-dependent hydrolase
MKWARAAARAHFVFSAMADDRHDYFQEGIELFNAGRFFECHEAWEQVWNRSQGEEKVAIQGLIQAAVAILHLERGNREGAQTLYAKARAKLDPLGGEFRGIAIAELRESLRQFFDVAFSEDPRSLPARPRVKYRQAEES